jgi:hypothetical protein
MKYEEAMRAIIEEPPDAWHKTSFGRGVHEVWVYRNDPHLRIETDWVDERFAHESDYKEPWVKNFTFHPKASSRCFYVYYGASLITNHILVSVDEGKTQLPQPRFGAKGTKVSRGAYAIARIVNHDEGDLEAAMKTAGFTVDDEG